VVQNISIHHSETNTELELKLKQIIEEIKNYPQASLNRKKALNRLLIAIQQSGQLSYPQKGLWPEQYYWYLREEAISKTFESIFKSIDRYDPKYSVMQWVNGILKNRFIDVLRSEKPKQATSFDGFDTEPVTSSTGKDREASDLRRQCIESSSILREKHIQEIPEATLARIVVMKYFEGQNLQTIAEKFQIPKHSTVASFLSRQIKVEKFQSALRKCLEDE
jgi:RNA polymerase sigma factor (sigma-70 family)